MSHQSLKTLKDSLSASYKVEDFTHDKKLPNEFKKLVTNIESSSLSYGEYCVTLTSSNDLSIIFPNQWLFIASYFCEYYNLLIEYKSRVYSILNLSGDDGKNKIKSCLNNPSFAASLFDAVNYHGEDRDYLIKFLSSPEWWGGGKGIERGDFFVSPILTMAKLINASQGYVADLCRFLAENPEALNALRNGKDFGSPTPTSISIPKSSDSEITSKDYLRAMRTKPFLLLAGISGTGKSRIVKQMAFDSCPDNAALRQDLTSPGNYCLVEVKPNWHDSTELLGYMSRIGGSHYVLTPFVKFLAKAMLHPEVPHFVCLDEMNLAPVEQYFAEFLSVLESRTKVGGHIVSEPLIKAEMFGKLISEAALFGREEEMPSDYYGFTTDDRAESYGKEHSVFETLQREGLRIPENVVIVGTVNMDETTHQFSRKVIDRAMIIEMNLPEGEPFKDFFENPADLEYRATPASKDLYLATETKAKDVVAQLAEADSGQTEWLKEEVAKFLTELNAALDGTPFKVAYRVQNELMLYFFQMWRENPNAEADWGKILNTSCDQILMMKVLPRIEGDDDLLGGVLNPENGTLSKFIQPYVDSAKKVDEMWKRLDNSRFTSFWP